MLTYDWTKNGGQVMTTLQANKRIALKHILFLTDFSEPSGTAVPFTASIARAYGSVVDVLHVLVPSAYTYLTPEMAAALLDEEEDRVRAEMFFGDPLPLPRSNVSAANWLRKMRPSSDRSRATAVFPWGRRRARSMRRFLKSSTDSEYLQLTENLGLVNALIGKVESCTALVR